MLSFLVSLIVGGLILLAIAACLCDKEQAKKQARAPRLPEESMRRNS